VGSRVCFGALARTEAQWKLSYTSNNPGGQYPVERSVSRAGFSSARTRARLRSSVARNVTVLLKVHLGPKNASLHLPQVCRRIPGARGGGKGATGESPDKPAETAVVC